MTYPADLALYFWIFTPLSIGLLAALALRSLWKTALIAGILSGMTGYFLGEFVSSTGEWQIYGLGLILPGSFLAMLFCYFFNRLENIFPSFEEVEALEDEFFLLDQGIKDMTIEALPEPVFQPSGRLRRARALIKND